MTDSQSIQLSRLLAIRGLTQGRYSVEGALAKHNTPYRSRIWVSPPLNIPEKRLNYS